MMHLFSRLSIHQSTCWLLRPWSFGLLGLETRNTEIVRKLTPAPPKKKTEEGCGWRSFNQWWASTWNLFSIFVCFATSAFCTQLAYYLDVSWFRPWISNLAWSDKTEKPRLFRCLEWHWLPFTEGWRLFPMFILTPALPHHSKVLVLKVFGPCLACHWFYWKIIRSVPSYSTGKSDS